MNNNFKFKVKPIFVLTVAAIILLVTAISSVTYAWIETGSNLHIKTGTGGDSANVSVVNRAGFARNMSKNAQDNVINLNEYVDYSNLYFAPATGVLVKDAQGNATDVKVSINGKDNIREAVPEDISTNYIDFEIKIKNNDITHSDIQFSYNDDERVVAIEGVDTKDAEFGVAVIATNTSGKKIIFTDSTELRTVPRSFETLYPGEVVTLRVKIWLKKEFEQFTDEIAGKPVKINLSLVMTDPKKTTFTLDDKTNSFDEEGLLNLDESNGYKLYAVNSAIIDENGEYAEKYPLSVVSTTNGKSVLSGMPEYLLTQACKNDHKQDGRQDKFELWAYEGGDLSKQPLKWYPFYGGKDQPELTYNSNTMKTYTIYGDLVVRAKELKENDGKLRGTWGEVAQIVLRDASVERLFCDESVRAVSFYNSQLSYPLCKTKVQNESGELVSSNELISYVPTTLLSNYQGFYFDSRTTEDCEGTHNLYATVQLNGYNVTNAYQNGEDGTVNNIENGIKKYVFTVFGANGQTSGSQKYCYGRWYSGGIDKITLRDYTTGRIMLDRYRDNEGIFVTFKDGFRGDGVLDRTYYRAHYDSDEKCWYTILPSTINDGNVKFRFKDGSYGFKEFDGSNRTLSGGKYIYSFVNLYVQNANPQQVGTWNYNPADDTVIIIKDGDANTDLYVEGGKNNSKPLGDVNAGENKTFGIVETVGETTYKTYYINKYDFGYGLGEQISGGTFTINLNNTDITNNSPYHVGGRYLIEGNTVTKLSSFGYVRPVQTIIADINKQEVVSAKVDFKENTTKDEDITYSIQVEPGEGLTALEYSASIGNDNDNRGQLTFSASKRGIYTVTVTASANEDGTLYSDTKRFIFKVDMTSRVAIKNNPNADMIFQYTDTDGIKRILVNGASADIVEGTVISVYKGVIVNEKFNSYSFYTDENGNKSVNCGNFRFKAYDANGAEVDPQPTFNNDKYSYTVAEPDVTLNAELHQEDSVNFVICGTGMVDVNEWNENKYKKMNTFSKESNLVSEDITPLGNANIQLKILKGTNASDRNNGDKSVTNHTNNDSIRDVKVYSYVNGVNYSFDNDNDNNLVLSGVNSNQKLRIEYDLTNHIINIRLAKKAINVTLFAVPEFEVAKLSVTAQGDGATKIEAGKDDATGIAYENTNLTLMGKPNNADFNSYMVDYFSVKTKKGDAVFDETSVAPGGKISLPSAAEVDSVEITTVIKKDDTPFYLASSSDAVSWNAIKTPMTALGNTVTGYVRLSGAQTGVYYIRIAKGGYEQEHFQNNSTSVTVPKTGRDNLNIVNSYDKMKAELDTQSLKVKLPPGVTTQTLKITYDLGNHVITVDTQVYFSETTGNVHATKGVATPITIGSIMPNGLSPTFQTVCATGTTDLTITGGDTATPTVKSDTIGTYTVVTTATVEYNGVEQVTSKTFTVEVTNLVNVTIKSHSEYALSGVRTKVTYEKLSLEDPGVYISEEFTVRDAERTIQVEEGKTVTLVLQIPNKNFNSYYADAGHNFTVEGATLDVNNDHITAKLTIPINSTNDIVIEPTPARYVAQGSTNVIPTFYVVGDSNKVDKLSWPSGSEAYNVKMSYDPATNSVTYSGLVLKGSPANIKIATDFKPGTNGYDDASASISHYTDSVLNEGSRDGSLIFDFKGASKSITGVTVTDNSFNDIQITNIAKANTPRKVDMTYYLAEHKLVFTDSTDATPIMTDDLLAVLRGQKVMFYFGINGAASGYLNESNKTGQNHTTLDNKTTYNNTNYNYASVCLPSETYFISNKGTNTGTTIGENAQGGKMYLLNGSSVEKLNSKSVCNMPNNTTINVEPGQTADLGVSLKNNTSVAGTANSLNYYITAFKEDKDYSNSDFTKFDPADMASLPDGSYAIFPVVTDNEIHVRADVINLRVGNAQVTDKKVTVKENPHATVKATYGTTTIAEGDTASVPGGSTITLTASIDNPKFNSYTGIAGFKIWEANSDGSIKTGMDPLATLNANNGTATYIPSKNIVVEVVLSAQTTPEYYITGENIQEISGDWDTSKNDVKKLEFDSDANTVSKVITLETNDVQFKIAKTTSDMVELNIDSADYSISESTPMPNIAVEEALKDKINFSIIDVQYEGVKHNFQITPKGSDTLIGMKVKVTYNLSTNTVTLFDPGAKSKHTVTLNPVLINESGSSTESSNIRATVTATYGTTTLNQGANENIPEETELTLSTNVKNSDFNCYRPLSYYVTGASLSGTNKVVVGKSDITIKPTLTRFRAEDIKFYLTGTGITANGKTLDWDNATAKYADMTYEEATNTVSQKIVMTADGAKLKISKDGYVGGTDKVGRDNNKYSVTLYKLGRDDVTVDNQATKVEGSIDKNKTDENRCLVLNYKDGASGHQTVIITYDLEQHKITISDVQAPTQVDVTVNAYGNYATHGISVKAVYSGGTITATNNNVGGQKIESGTTLTLSAEIPNATLNKYKLNGFTVTEKANAEDAGTIRNVTDSGNGSYSYKIPESGVQFITIVADIDVDTVTYKLANSTNNSDWDLSGDALTLSGNEVSGTVTLTGNAASETVKYFRIAKVKDNESNFASAELGDVHDYSTTESNSVKVTLPAGLTKQQLKFTYNLRTNEVTVEAPVKFTYLGTENSVITNAKVNTDVPLDSTATATGGVTPSYDTACVGTTNVTITGDKTATPTFNATSDTGSPYTVTTTATATVGGVEYQAVKTYTITVTSKTVDKQGDFYVEYYNSGHQFIGPMSYNENTGTYTYSSSSGPDAFKNKFLENGQFRITKGNTWDDSKRNEYLVSYKKAHANVKVENYVKLSPGVQSKNVSIQTTGHTDNPNNNDKVGLNTQHTQYYDIKLNTAGISSLFTAGFCIDYILPDNPTDSLNGTIYIRLASEPGYSNSGTTEPTPDTVNVTVNAHSEFAKSGITVKAEYGSGSVTTITGQGNRDVDFNETLTLTATIPNADFNNYTFTQFKIEEKNDSDTVLATKYVTTNGGTYKLENASATKVVITAEFSTETQKTLTFASSSDKSSWTPGISLTSPQDSADANFNTFTGTFNVTTAGNKYISICSGSDTTKLIKLTNDLFTSDDNKYAVFDSGCVLAKLPIGATEQTLKFTYTPADGKIAVDAPVKFAETQTNLSATVGQELKETLSVVNGENVTYSVPEGAKATIDSSTNKITFNTDTVDSGYDVVVTATDANGYVATKTYHVTVSSASTRKVTVLANDYAVVTATPAGGTVIAEDANADVGVGTTITLNATLKPLPNGAKINPYRFNQFTITTGTGETTLATNGGTYEIPTGTGDIQIAAVIDTVDPNLYICGGNIDGLNSNWQEGRKLVWSSDNPEIAYVDIQLNANDTQFKIAQTGGDNTSDGAANRDKPAWSLSMYGSNGDSGVQPTATGSVNISGTNFTLGLQSDGNRNFTLSGASGKTVRVTYNMMTHTVTISDPSSSGGGSGGSSGGGHTQEFGSVHLVGIINGNSNWETDAYPLSYDSKTDYWSKTIALNAGDQIKARANNAWDISFGFKGGNYNIKSNGTYKITIKDGSTNGTSLTVTPIS